MAVMRQKRGSATPGPATLQYGEMYVRKLSATTAKVYVGLGAGNNVLVGGTGATVPTGGTTGQVLTKQSNADGDTIWSDVAIPAHNHDDRYFTEAEVAATYATLSSLSTHVGLTNTAHGATAAQTANTLMARDANGRTAVSGMNFGGTGWDDYAQKWYAASGRTQLMEWNVGTTPVLRMRQVGSAFDIGAGGESGNWLRFFGDKDFSDENSGVGRLDFHAGTLIVFRSGWGTEFVGPFNLSRNTGGVDTTSTATQKGSYRQQFQGVRWNGANANFHYQGTHLEASTTVNGEFKQVWWARPRDNESGVEHVYMVLVNGTHANAGADAKLGIGTYSPTESLDAPGGNVRCQAVKLIGQAADPVGVNGMMYYNSTTNKFRGYAAGAWTDLH